MSTDVLTPPAAATTATPAAAPVDTKPWVDGWLQTDGKINTSRYDHLPEDVRHIKSSLERHNTADGLMRHVANLELMAGKKGLAPLAPDAPKEAIEARNQLLDQVMGVPKEAKDYNFTRPDNIPAERWNQAGMDEAAALFKKWHLPKEGATELMALRDKTIAFQEQAQEAATQKWYTDQDLAVKTLAANANIPFDKAQAQVNRIVEITGLNPNDPIWKDQRAFALALKAAQLTGESALVTGTDASPVGGDKSRAEDVIQNKSNPLHAIYHDANHPQHRQVVDKVQAWMAQAYKQPRR